jgi:hypothetical protein
MFRLRGQSSYQICWAAALSSLLLDPLYIPYLPPVPVEFLLPPLLLSFLLTLGALLRAPVLRMIAWIRRGKNQLLRSRYSWIGPVLIVGAFAVEIVEKVIRAEPLIALVWITILGAFGWKIAQAFRTRKAEATGEFFALRQIGSILLLLGLLGARLMVFLEHWYLSILDQGIFSHLFSTFSGLIVLLSLTPPTLPLGPSCAQCMSVISKLRQRGEWCKTCLRMLD